MLRMVARGSGVAALLAAPLLLSACAAENLECSPETEELNGYCTIVPEPSPNCGEGTDLDVTSNTCVARIECGDGTELNPDTGECESLFACGPGTVIDLATGECVVTVQCGLGTILVDGECVTEASCGPGTLLEVLSQSCVAVDPCATGTVYNVDNGLCESDLSCADNQVEVNGICLPEGRGVAGLASAWENAADGNDPAVGGTPEQLPALAPEGEPLVFLGKIGRPADYDGNGSVDQDRDVWQFDGEAGQYLDIQILSAGLPQPVFILDGPGGYHRESFIGFARDATREVLLPRTGSYRLIVVPSVYQTAGLAIGGTEADYVGVIEALPLPSMASMVPSNDPEAPSTIFGNLSDLSDNFIQLQAPARTAVVVDFAELEADAAPAVIAFGTDGHLVSDVVIEREQGTWAATFVSETNGTWLVIDWVSSHGPDDGFEAELQVVALVEAGVLAGSSSIATPEQDIAAGATGAYAYELLGNQVLQLNVAAQGSFPEPDLQLLGPDGTRSVVWDSPSLFAFAEPGEFVVFVRNDDPDIDQNGVFLSGALPATVDLGTLDPGGPETVVTVSGDRLTFAHGGPESFWAIVTTPPATMLELQVTAEAGDAELAVFARSGRPLRRVRRPDLNRLLHVLNEGGETLVIDLHPLQDLAGKSGAVEGWSLRAEALTQPVSIDGEPNDTQLDATVVGDLPFIGTGTLTETTAAFDFRDKDVYSFTVAETLDPGQVVALWFDNLDADPALFDLGAVSLRVYDEDRQPVSQIPGQTGPVSGVLEASSVTYLANPDVGHYHVELIEWKVEETARYVLRGAVIDSDVELEPNEDMASATVIGSLPANVVGYWDSDDDTVDTYRLDLAGPLPGGSSLVVNLDNLETPDNLVLELRDGADATLAVALGPRVSVQAAALAAGPYFIRVTGTATQSPPYALKVAFGPPMEVEPNDTAGQATAMGELTDAAPLIFDGMATVTSTDIFTFSFPAGAPSAEDVIVEAVNLTDTSNVRVDFYYGADPATDTLISSDAGPVARAINKVAPSAGPFAVKVTGNGDRYRLIIETGPPAESEPNEDDAASDFLPLPGTIYGVINAPDTDVFRVSIADDLSGSEFLMVSVTNTVDQTPIGLELLATDFSTVYGTDAGPSAVVATGAGLNAGDYFIRLREPAGSTFETDYYELSAQIVDTSVGGGQ